MKRVWTLPKAGNTPEENEDAVALCGRVLAVADGATEAFASRVWARLLVESIAAGDEGEIAAPSAWFWGRVDAARETWVAWRATQELAWNEEQAAARGSAAAIAVLIVEPRAGRVRGLAVGDVCAVRLRAGEVPFLWPLSASSAFTTRPPLIGTRSSAQREVEDFTTPYQVGDRWLVLTDALAAWALRCAEAGEPLWEELVGLDDAGAWQQFVQTARAAGMKNDDTTLVVWQGRSHRRRPPLARAVADG
jgi:hypothetical protein